VKPFMIDILGVPYEVSFVKGLAKKKGCAGITSVVEYTIKLDKGLIEYPKSLEATFWHEIGHAFVHESGLCEILKKQSSEMFCQNFQAFMMGSMKRISV
jgi:hypothetical protein